MKISSSPMHLGKNIGRASFLPLLSALLLCAEWMTAPVQAAESKTPSALSASMEEISKNFARPPEEARPWVYWFWNNGNVSKEGITADLEAMQRVGIGGVLIMEVGVGAPAGKVPYNSPVWHEMTKFAISEAARLGLKVNITNAPGWAGSGGPWITPELSEQKLIWTETLVQGPVHYDSVLPKPQFTSPFKECVKAVGDYSKDITLLAFPTPLDDDVNMADFSPKVTASATDPKVDLQEIVSAKGEGKLLLPKPEPGKPQYVQVEFTHPFTARTLNLTLNGSPEWSRFQAELQISDDGNNFKTVRKFGGQLEEVMLGFEAITARYFKVLFTLGDDRMPPKFGVRALQLNPHNRIDDLRGKTLVTRGNVPSPAKYPELPAGLAIDKSRVIDLTSKMDKEGRLSWEAPAGRWTLLRIGHTSRGMFNHPAPQGGLGMECDKLSKEAADAHFAALMGKLIEDAGTLSGKTLVSTHIDSWETGTQNWTARFREEFQARRGYDLLRFLPSMTGRVVDTPEVTERFLWDFRQTASELLAENYSGRIQELAHQRGLKLSIEAYGSGSFDDMTYGARADVPMAEFWYLDNRAGETATEMSSIAHVYGKPIVAAEAFTADANEKWLGHPAAIKSEGDWAFSMGINRLVFHRYAMQPWTDQKPGMSMGPYGLHYERTQTWWEQSGPWHQYLTRCQYLLQQGLCAKDICYLAAEGAPRSSSAPHELSGYACDGAPAESLLTRFSVKDGRLVLPDGMSYRVLVLPGAQTMTPTLLRKVKELVADGATIIGPRPIKSPSLANYPACDAEIKALADELWADCNGKTVTEHRLGKGRILWGPTPQQVLSRMGVSPDFAYRDSKSNSNLLYTHRILGDADVYFVANPKDHAVEGVCTLRVSGKRPEIWRPETGQIERIARYDAKEGVTNIPLFLEATESVFIVLRPTQEPFDSVAAIQCNGKPILPAAEARPVIVIQRASYGVRDDSVRTRDVTADIQEMVAKDASSLPVRELVKGGDPAYGVVKTVEVDYSVNGEPRHASARDDENLCLATTPIVIQKATYGVPGDLQRTRNVEGILQKVVNLGNTSFPVADFAKSGDPADGIVKTATVDYTRNGKAYHVTGKDFGTLSFADDETPTSRVASLRFDAKGKMLLEAWTPGTFAIKTASGKSTTVAVKSLPAPTEVAGPWDVTFPPNWGAPDAVTFDKLISWSDHSDPGVKYFSGTATYHKTLQVPAELIVSGQRLYLDLGNVQVIAEVTLNGKKLGVLWKPPFSREITDAVKAGDNTLEVKVTNLWPNRMMGDEQLPEDSERNPEGALKTWPQWLLDGKPNPTGRFTFTTWRLWKKNDALLPSGLLGPVTLRATAERVVEPSR